MKANELGKLTYPSLAKHWSESYVTGTDRQLNNVPDPKEKDYATDRASTAGGLIARHW